ncbi:hypothetical protein [Saccharothrix sp.]|uniref:hypothetical protein n=1 Tax=Saccharothrix sp. TaxID=1873460 RepID=UPI00281181F9|nr:hypothetical protein [Saccharothrix sp.]
MTARGTRDATRVLAALREANAALADILRDKHIVLNISSKDALAALLGTTSIARQIAMLLDLYQRGLTNYVESDHRDEPTADNQPVGGLVEEQVAAYLDVCDSIRQAALSAAKSADRIGSVADALGSVMNDRRWRGPNYRH